MAIKYGISLQIEESSELLWSSSQNNYSMQH